MAPTEELLARWRRTTTHLEAAFTLLPTPIADGAEGGTVASYRDFVEHGELGLAFEELELLAEANAVTSADFWTHMAEAAGAMELMEKAAECRRRSLHGF